MAQDSGSEFIQPPSEELQMPRTQKELEDLLGQAKRDGAIVAIRSIQEELAQPVTAINLFSSLRERGVGITTEILGALEESARNAGEILTKYIRATSSEERIGFAKSRTTNEEFLNIHPSTQNPPTSEHTGPSLSPQPSSPDPSDVKT